MRTLDLLLTLITCYLAYLSVFHGGHTPPSLPLYQVAIIGSLFLQLVVFHTCDMYRAWRGEDQFKELTQLCFAWTVVFAVLVFLSVITKTSASFSRQWLILWYASGILSLAALRLALRYALRALRSRGYNLRHIVILANQDIGKRVLDAITSSPESGFNLVGYFSASIPSGLDHKVRVGVIGEGLSFAKKNRVDQIWIAMPLREEDRIREIMDELKDVTADIRLVPDFFGFRLLNHSISNVVNMAVVNLSVTPMDGVNRWIKAVEDRSLSLLIMIVISPLLLLIAALVKINSPGPVFYLQERISWNGKSFQMIKFRTMPVGVELESGPVWASSDETRATRVGALLRKTSLDELPQFWNVLKGDMSIVGPRPERPVFVDRFKDEIPSYMQKHKVKAGITGWAQVNGWRGNTDLQKRIEYDLFYIENWSLAFDIKIILMTVIRGFIHKNAY